MSAALRLVPLPLVAPTPPVEVAQEVGIVVGSHRSAQGRFGTPRPDGAPALDESQHAVHHEGEQCDEYNGLSHGSRVGRCANSGRVYAGPVKEFAVYTLARLGIFAATYAILAGLWLLVTGSLPVFLPLLLAAVVSAIASIYVLRGQREQFAAVVERRAAAAAAKVEAARSKEDVD